MKTNAIQIEFDAKSGRFLVRCPIFANELITAAPSRTWSRQARAWLLPATRKNVEFIEDQLKGLANLDEQAQEAVAEVKSTVEKLQRGSKFPAHYKYKTEPFPYQKVGVEKGYGKHAFALYMDMGTGKSKVITDLVAAMVLDGKVNSVLLVCKLTLLGNWIEQLNTHCPIPFSHRVHSNDLRGFVNWMHDTKDKDLRIYMIGTESLSAGLGHQFAEKFLLMSPKAATVVDEAHMISNHKAKRTERVIGFGRMCDYRMVATGTPISSGPMNLFAQFEFLDPNIIGIGDFYAFRNRYAIMGGPMVEIRGRKQAVQIVGYQNLQELIGLVEPHVYQVRKSDVLVDLPAKRYTVRRFQLTKEQTEFYKKVTKEKYEFDGKDITLKNVLEVMLRQQQICGGFIADKTAEQRWHGKTEEWLTHEKVTMHPIVPYDKNPKIAELLDILDENARAPTIIWSRYKPEQAAIMSVLRARGDRCALIDGDVSPEERTKIANEFQTGGIDYLVSSQQVGGVGLTLTRASVVVFFSNTFSYVDRDQAEDRAHRIGQKNSVLYVDLVAEGTLEEKAILPSIREKRDVADYVRDQINNDGRPPF